MSNRPAYYGDLRPGSYGKASKKIVKGEKINPERSILPSKLYSEVTN